MVDARVKFIGSSSVRISLFVRTVFIDKAIMFAEHDHRYGDGSIRLGKFTGYDLNRSLNDKLAKVWLQAVIDFVQLNVGKRP